MKNAACMWRGFARAAVAAGLAAEPALAQSNVSLYGIIDVAVAHTF
jgi:predicted porin